MLYIAECRAGMFPNWDGFLDVIQDDWTLWLCPICLSYEEKDGGIEGYYVFEAKDQSLSRVGAIDFDASQKRSRQLLGIEKGDWDTRRKREQEIKVDIWARCSSKYGGDSFWLRFCDTTEIEEAYQSLTLSQDVDIKKGCFRAEKLILGQKKMLLGEKTIERH